MLSGKHIYIVGCEKMTKKFEKWEKLREKGKWNYILKYGVMIWGVGTAVFFSLIISFVMERETSFFLILLISLILFPLGGIAWGAFMWSFIERSYARNKTTEQVAESDAANRLP